MAKESTATTGAAAAAASTTSAADAAAAKAAKAAKALRKFVSSQTYRDVSTSPPPVVLTYLFTGLFPVCRYWQTHHPYYFWCVSVESEDVGSSLGLTRPSFSLLLPFPPTGGLSPLSLVSSRSPTSSASRPSTLDAAERSSWPSRRARRTSSGHRRPTNPTPSHGRSTRP